MRKRRPPARLHEAVHARDARHPPPHARLAAELGPSHDRTRKALESIVALSTAWGRDGDAARYRSLLTE
jgi:hypothetical protein